MLSKSSLFPEVKYHLLTPQKYFNKKAKLNHLTKEFYPGKRWDDVNSVSRTQSGEQL